jgi:hypothetical protein
MKEISTYTVYTVYLILSLARDISFLYLGNTSYVKKEKLTHRVTGVLS